MTIDKYDQYYVFTNQLCLSMCPILYDIHSI